jgi:inorganic triphosphatase YgiF
MPDIIECLQVRTQNLRNEIEWIKASRAEDAQAVLQQLSQLRTELSTCGNLLRDPGFAGGGAISQRAASEYRDCIQRLQEALSVLRSDLLARRCQLRPQQEHVDAAAEWLQSSKTTLE